MVRRQFNAALRIELEAKRKKDWKKIDYEIINIPTICFEDEEFFKIDGSQDLRQILNETKDLNIMTNANINWTIDELGHKTIIDVTGRRFRTLYPGSTEEARIDDQSKRSSRVDNVITAKAKERLRFLNTKDTINQITDQLRQVQGSDASQE